MLSPRPTSERRAAAARANGAKSRGPVSTPGRANSSRNNLRHGLRARILFPEPASDSELAALLAPYLYELQPQSELEYALVKTLALSHWRRTRLWNLETEILNHAMKEAESRIDPESRDTPLAFAFRALTDGSCALELLNRFDSRCAREYSRARNRLRELHADRAGSPERTHLEKVIINERTQQLIENKRTLSETTQQTHPSSTEPELPRPALPPLEQPVTTATAATGSYN